VLVRILVLAAAALAASGCSKGGVDAVKELRSLACAGDVAGFFSHVDRKAMAENARAPGLDAATVTSIMDAGLRDWEDDIKHGAASDVCKMSVMEANEIDGTADVHVRTPSGKDRHWRLSRIGGRWLLVRVGP
jgi:hypothetical protein